MPKLSNETKQFIGQMFTPGLMFLCAILFAYLPDWSEMNMTPEQLTRTVTVAESLRAFSVAIKSYVTIMFLIFTPRCVSAVCDWLEARKIRKEHEHGGRIHVAESD